MPGKGRPFPKGKSGNPGGKPKKNQELEALCQKVCKGTKQRNGAIEDIASIATSPSTSDRDRLEAWRILLAYGYGKPRQCTELSTDPENPLRVVTYNLPENGR
jgi:hypothetical protein